MFSWRRILTVALGVGLAAVGTVLVQPAFVVAGVGVVTWSIPHLDDEPKKFTGGAKLSDRLPPHD